MKRYYLFFALFVAISIPIGVNATSAAFSLSCDQTVTKGGTVNCTLSATVSGGALKTVNASIDVNDNLTKPENINVSGLNISSSGTVKSFTVSSKQVTGTGTIGVSSISATDDTTSGTCNAPSPVTADWCDAISGTWDNDSCTDGENNITTEAVCTTASGSWTANSNVVSVTNPSSESIRILNNDTTINSIKVGGSEASCDKTASSCSVSSNSATTSIDVTASAAKQVTGTGTKNLSCGVNNYDIKIIAENNSVRTYKLVITRNCNSDNTLKGITVSSGTLSPSFSPNTRNYTVKVTGDTDKITISATKSNSSQTVKGEVTNRALEFGNNIFTISITSENSSSGSYKITVVRADNRSTNNYLKSLELSDGVIDFKKATLEYKVKVLYEVTKIKVTGVAEDEKATVSYANNEQELKVGKDNIISVTVKSEKGEEKVYKINVERLKEGETLGDNPNLSNIEISGYDLTFKKGITEYTIKNVKEETLNITATPEDKTAIVKITGNENLKNGSVIKITCTSLDGTEKEYSIVVEKSNPIILIIAAILAILVAVGLIVYIIIKNSKSKGSKESNVKKVKQETKDDDALLAKVQAQLSKGNIVTDEQSDSTITNQKENLTVTDESLPTHKTEIGDSRIERQIIKEQNEVKEEMIKPEATKEIVNLNVFEEKREQQPESTRVCSICGHRVSDSLKICPYCKRQF